MNRMKNKSKEKPRRETAKIDSGFLDLLQTEVPAKPGGADALQLEEAGRTALKILAERREDFSEKEQSFFAMLAWFCLLKREEQEKVPEVAA